MAEVRASRRSWLRILKSMMAKKGKSRIDVVSMDFADAGLLVRQMDRSRVIGLVMRVPPEYFEGYQAIGTVQVSPGTLIEAIEDYFKDETLISLYVQDDYLVLRGDGGTVYREPVLAVGEEDAPQLPEDSLAEVDGVVYINKSRPAYLYDIEPAFIKSVKKKWSYVALIGSKSYLKARVDAGAASVEKILAGQARVAEYESELKAVLAAEELALIGQAIEGPTRVLLTIGEDGSVGPVTIQWSYASMTTAYLLVPMVE